ncbi:MAG TPA: hypothetical protein PLM93_08160 [Sulfuricurvum sp.]|nr:hypothetical protein [Sulfuricurvum sp.]HQT36378.1 hypothetical protein [Sulfuricurvum sp.]
MAFEARHEQALFLGTIVHKKHNIAQLNGTITGSIFISCDICAETFENTLNEEVSFYLADGDVHENDRELEIVEIDNSIINLDELFDSELELIKSDYFCCSDCEGKTLEQEF